MATHPSGCDFFSHPNNRIPTECEMSAYKPVDVWKESIFVRLCDIRVLIAEALLS
jgi:hypothetical protein